jgi:predicted metal-dependent hydrolase
MTREMVDLTATTALEHFTATIASELLRNKHIQDLMTDDHVIYVVLACS